MNKQDVPEAGLCIAGQGLGRRRAIDGDSATPTSAQPLGTGWPMRLPARMSSTHRISRIAMPGELPSRQSALRRLRGGQRRSDERFEGRGVEVHEVLHDSAAVNPQPAGPEQFEAAVAAGAMTPPADERRWPGWYARRHLPRRPCRRAL